MRRLRGLRSVLAGRDFRRLYATRLISQSGDGLFQVALAAYAFFDPQRQPTAPAVAGAFAALLLPYSLVGPWAGVFLDRWRRRQVLVFANLVRGSLVLVMAGVIAAGAPLAVLLGLGLAVVSVNRFFLAALSAALPHVVARTELVTANSLSTTSGTIAAFAGGGLGYGLRLVFGEGATGTALLLATTTVWYLCSSLVALTMAKQLLGPDDGPTRLALRTALGDVAHGLAAGAQHVWSRRPAGHALLVMASQRFWYGLATLSVLLLYRNYFHADEVAAGIGGLALVLGATGVGLFLAALITPVATRRLRKQTWITVVLVGAGVAQLAFGLPYRELLFVPAALLLGLAAQSMKICVDTLVQETVDDSFRGRVFSFYDVLFNVSFVSAAAVAAVALPATGKSYAVLTLIALGHCATGLGYAAVNRRSSRGSTVSAAGEASR
ncbi:MAG: MFS transporter [Streptosporangiales bacterium]|nr:MFS transporter [Streptosporangiales bacterium]